MKNKVIILIVSTVFIGILVLASVTVNKLSKNMFLDTGVSGENMENNNEEEEKMSILEVTNENFEEEVLNSEKTVSVDFYAEWCGPCLMMAPVVEKIASENADIKVRKINIDNEEELAIKYRVVSIPTFLVIKNGEEVNRIVGAVDKAELEEAIK